MKISIICPTRGRTISLWRGLVSIIKTANDVSNLEFIIRFDEDDNASLNSTMEFFDVELVSHPTEENVEFNWGNSTYQVINTTSKKHNGMSMIFIRGTRHGYNLLNRYYDEASHVSTGEYLVIWSDDMEIKNTATGGWDSHVREAEGQFYIFTFDWDDGFPRIVPRKYFELNNTLSPNVLDDRFWIDFLKMFDVHIQLEYKSDHNCQFDSGGDPLIEGYDLTAVEGRGNWIRQKGSDCQEEWQFFDIEHFNRIARYLKDNPNTNTPRNHISKFYGQAFTGHTLCWQPK